MNDDILDPCECDDGRYCERHYQEQLRAYAYLRGAPRYTVFGDAQALEERDQELRDAGRGHLVKP